MTLSEDNVDVKELVPIEQYVCLPGDPVLMLNRQAVIAVSGLQPLGLLQSAETATSSIEVLTSEYSGTLQRQAHLMHRHVRKYVVESPAIHRYRPAPGDPVIAIITKKFGSHYHCYTGGSAMAYLDALAFDGATKTNRPRLTEGDVVYCYVKKKGPANILDRDVPSSDTSRPLPIESSNGEVELSCTATEVGLAHKDWTSGEAYFGPLDGGRVISVPLPYARSLLAPSPLQRASAGQKRSRDETDCNSAEGDTASDGKANVPASYLLDILGARAAFEVCIGMNGLVWVRGLPQKADPIAELRRTVAVSACITEAQFDTTREEIEARVEGYFPTCLTTCMGG